MELPDQIISPALACQLLGVNITYSQLRQLVAKGELKTVNTQGGHSRYFLNDVLACAERIKLRAETYQQQAAEVQAKIEERKARAANEPNYFRTLSRPRIIGERQALTQLNLHIPLDLHEAIEAAAKAEQLNKRAFVMKVVKNYLNKENK
jgi:hypothetical protein